MAGVVEAGCAAHCRSADGRGALLNKSTRPSLPGLLVDGLLGPRWLTVRNSPREGQRHDAGWCTRPSPGGIMGVTTKHADRFLGRASGPGAGPTRGEREMRPLSLAAAIVALVAASACRSAAPAIRQWETSAVPICGPDTEGAIVESSMLNVKPELAGRVVSVRGDGTRVPVSTVRFHQFSVGLNGAVEDWDPPLPTSSFLRSWWTPMAASGVPAVSRRISCSGSATTGHWSRGSRRRRGSSCFARQAARTSEWSST
jgi:hypothetical protein